MKINLQRNIIKKLNKNIFSLIILVFLILIFIQKFNLVTNAYYIVNKNYYARLSSSYEKLFFSGFCEKESHGYIIHIKEKYINSQIPKIINLQDYRRLPYWIFNNENKNINENKIILLNYDANLNNSKNNIDFSNYKILDNFQNRCFFLEIKND